MLPEKSKVIAKDGTNRGIKHGLCHVPEYIVFQGMRQRCYDPKQEYYVNYGGRGIKICDRWLADFKNFYDDMGPRPTPRHQIDRIDNDKDYSPDNCRWVECKDNLLNKGEYKNNVSGFKGVSFDKRAKFKPWRATVMRDRKQKQIGAFATAEEANAARIKFLENWK